MDLLHQFVDLFMHLDKHLDVLVAEHGAWWVYVILWLIVFCETGLVVTPLLPGDSLLFAAGTLAALDAEILIPLLITAALAGDNVNYFIGRAVGPRVFSRPKSWLLNPKHLQRTRDFYEDYGRKTIIIARFVPIVRTFAPFVAGIGAMRYRVFLIYSIIGACLWVPICVMAGHFLGQFDIVRNNFSIVILAVVGISILPAVVEYYRARRRHAQEAAAVSKR